METVLQNAALRDANKHSFRKKVIAFFIGISSAFIDNMQTAGSQLNEQKKPAGMLLSDEEFAGDLKSMIKNLKAGSQKLDEDLEALQHNFLLRGYFRKKAKSKSK